MRIVAGVVFGFIVAVVVAGMGYETAAGFIWVGSIVGGVVWQVNG